MREPQQPPNLALGRAINRLRREARLSQQQLADRAQLPVEELQMIESGKTDARWGTVRRLAYGLEVELPDLFKLTEELEASGEQ